MCKNLTGNYWDIIWFEIWYYNFRNILVLWNLGYVSTSPGLSSWAQRKTKNRLSLSYFVKSKGDGRYCAQHDGVFNVFQITKIVPIFQSNHKLWKFLWSKSTETPMITRIIMVHSNWPFPNNLKEKSVLGLMCAKKGGLVQIIHNYRSFFFSSAFSKCTLYQSIIRFHMSLNCASFPARPAPCPALA